MMMITRCYSSSLLAGIALLLVAANAQQTTTTGPCDLDCYHNTTCVPGSADFSQHPRPDGQPLDIHTETISPNGWRCDCPDGKTGLRCGRTYIGCQNSDHQCYNGGSCIPGVTDRFGNTQEFCDCGDAIDEFGVKHVGKYCEIPVPVTCGEDSDDVFCVNGGHCKENWKEETHRPCRCGPEHDGQHCEYAKGAVPDCTLTCENGGHCKLGFKTYQDALSAYQDFWEDNYNGTLMHCACPYGFFGPRCEVVSTLCDDKHCFNGGKCHQILKDDGSTKQYCECAKASAGGNHFSGQYCQYEATSFCTNDKVEGDIASFCLNGGECKDGGLDCTCKDGFSGPICEFADSETTASCNLECQNGGICIKGHKDYSYMNKGGIDMAELTQITNNLHNEDFEACKCPASFTGLTCETKVQSCSSVGSHICLHGSTCVQAGDTYTCDCNAIVDSRTRFAGKYCQYQSTSLCTPDGMPGKGKNKNAFCVNKGKCLKIVGDNEEHAGCECDPEFTGTHCEVRSSASEFQNPSHWQPGGESGPSGIAIFFIVIGVLSAFVIVVVAYRRLNNQKEQPDFDDDGIFDDTSRPPVLDMGPEKDVDGNELENVEII